MQNLTARYNYLYNASVILDTYQAELQENYIDNFSQVLPVYVTPEKFNSSSKDPVAAPVNDKALDRVIEKVQTIISDKSYSNYISNSYILLGKAQFYKGNYFISKEYFDYVIKTYHQNIAAYIQALDWKARSLMQLDNLKDAAVVLDTLETHLNQVKKNRSEPLATLAQMSIYLHRHKEAISYLETAIKENHNHKNRIRWRYILAQLFERQHNYEQALLSFTKVQKSNAGFELYFNANLNRIKLYALLKDRRVNRKQQLAALLKDDKNTDYKDQIYFQMAEYCNDNSDYKEAEKYYECSVSNSIKNQEQKGLSYLKIADLNFKYFKNYSKAKTYYDSTVNTLPDNYSGYDLIVKKTQSLEYLISRYQIIALQDTLQSIAKLPESNRMARIQAVLIPAEPQAKIANIPASPNNPFRTENVLNKNETQTPELFYFNNPVAVSKGFSDFKKSWGNRKLEDNWRQSIRSSAQENTQNTININNSDLPTSQNAIVSVDPKELAKTYFNTLPITPELLTASNQKIIDAYYKIASFYQQELNENEEAIEIYQTILQRFPENKYLVAINYGLYLSYKDTDAEKAAVYKEIVLSKFPSTSYAKAILEFPSYAKRSEQTSIHKRYQELLTEHEQNGYPIPIGEEPNGSSKQPGLSVAQKKSAQNNTIAPIIPVAPIVPVKTDGIFSTAGSSIYYYVIDVSDASLTLNSSRFGIGQFNRENYTGQNLKHQLKEFDNDQLIYIGNFSNLEDAKKYADGITPLLKEIMKVPANVYTGFIISKENFDKLKNKDLLNKYVEFYKNNN